MCDGFDCTAKRMKKLVQRDQRKGGTSVYMEPGSSYPVRLASQRDAWEDLIARKLTLHAQERNTAATETLVSENEKVSTMPLPLMVSFH